MWIEEIMRERALQLEQFCYDLISSLLPSCVWNSTTFTNISLIWQEREPLYFTLPTSFGVLWPQSKIIVLWGRHSDLIGESLATGIIGPSADLFTKGEVHYKEEMCLLALQWHMFMKSDITMIPWENDMKIKKIGGGYDRDIRRTNHV